MILAVQPIRPGIAVITEGTAGARSKFRLPVFVRRAMHDRRRGSVAPKRAVNRWRWLFITFLDAGHPPVLRRSAWRWRLLSGGTAQDARPPGSPPRAVHA